MGDVAAVRRALDAGSSASEADECGSLPLQSAILCGGGAVRSFGFGSDGGVAVSPPGPPHAIVRLLVERGAGLEVQDDHGMTALLAAACIGSADLLSLLIELGADVAGRRGRSDDREREGSPPLHELCGTPVQTHLPAAVAVLLEAGADPDSRTASGATPLIFLCRAMASRAALEALDLLLDAGAHPSLADENGYTPLMTLDDEWGELPREGSASGEAMRVLLRRGAEEKELASLELLRAAKVGDLARVKRELDRGASPTFTSRRGGTALSSAAAYGHADVVREILVRAGDRTRDSDRDASLVAAASGGHLEAARLLLDAGANPDGGEPWRRPLDVAPPDSPLERLLLERGGHWTTLATERGCPNFDLTQQVILVQADAAEIISALETIVSPTRIERSVKGKKVAIARASLLVYQLAGHGWSAIQPVSGKPKANRFDHDLGVALSRTLATRALLYDNSDSTATFGWELLSNGETEELFAAGDPDASPHLVPWNVSARFDRDRDEGGDPDADEREIYFSRSSGAPPEASRSEEFLDLRARELDLLVPSWSPRDVGGKPGASKAFFSREKKETFRAVDYVVLED